MKNLFIEKFSASINYFQIHVHQISSLARKEIKFIKLLTEEASPPTPLIHYPRKAKKTKEPFPLLVSNNTLSILYKVEGLSQERALGGSQCFEIKLFPRLGEGGFKSQHPAHLDCEPVFRTLTEEAENPTCRKDGLPIQTGAGCHKRG